MVGIRGGKPLRIVSARKKERGKRGRISRFENLFRTERKAFGFLGSYGRRGSRRDLFSAV